MRRVDERVGGWLSLGGGPTRAAYDAERLARCRRGLEIFYLFALAC